MSLAIWQFRPGSCHKTLQNSVSRNSCAIWGDSQSLSSIIAWPIFCIYHSFLYDFVCLHLSMSFASFLTFVYDLFLFFLRQCHRISQLRSAVWIVLRRSPGVLLSELSLTYVLVKVARLYASFSSYRHLQTKKSLYYQRQPIKKSGGRGTYRPHGNVHAFWLRYRQ